MRHYHQYRQVFHTFNRVPRPAAILLKEVQRMEMFAVNEMLLAEQIDAAICFHVMGYKAEQAYRAAHEMDCNVMRVASMHNVLAIHETQLARDGLVEVTRQIYEWAAKTEGE